MMPYLDILIASWQLPYVYRIAQYDRRPCGHGQSRVSALSILVMLLSGGIRDSLYAGVNRLAFSPAPRGPGGTMRAAQGCPCELSLATFAIRHHRPHRHPRSLASEHTSTSVRTDLPAVESF